MKTLISAIFGTMMLFQPVRLWSAAGEEGERRPMEITIGGSITHRDKDADARLEASKRLGVTSVEIFVNWKEVEKTPGVFDWSELDADVALYMKHGIKSVPFVTAGPWYATPEFVRKDPRIVMFRCLEHDRDSAIPSMWCERTREYFRGWLQALAAHYRPMGVIESVKLAITGDYGEAIYPVVGNWPGAYHSHPGYWCGDALAVADFRRAMRELYPGGIAALNQAWHAHYGSFDEVRPFPPAQAPSERAWQEFLGWYRGAMTAYADYCLRTTREIFPQTEIYLATGGDMAPEHGSDFGAQAKVAARYDAGIRITNEASSFPMNIRYTRMADSAARFYGTYVGHEPAATVTPTGMLGRVFNAVTGGARQLHFYETPELFAVQDGRLVPGEFGQYLQRYGSLLKTVHPLVQVAVYQRNPSSRETEFDHKEFGELVAQIRRFVDYDFVDDPMIKDGALREKAILIIADADLIDAATTERITNWVRDGGVVFAFDRRAKDWDGSTAAFDALVGFTPETDKLTGITNLQVKDPKSLPSIAALSDLSVTFGYTALQAGCEPMLVMEYDPKASVAWRRRLGRGEVFAYFGPMDLKQDEANWMVAQQLPLRFMKDALKIGVAEGVLKAVPPTLNLSAPDVYEVQTNVGLWILNMGNEPRKIEKDGTAVEVPALSIVAPKRE